MNSVTKFGLLLVITALGFLTLSGCASPQTSSDNDAADGNTLVRSDNLPKNQATAIFAMGCFWCAESDFEKVDGVISAVSGYTGGALENPTYEQVSYTETGHYEAVLVTYDTTKLTYSDLLSIFWKNVDPFDGTGQFCDKGSSYRAAIFPESKSEIAMANDTKKHWAEFLKRELATAIIKRSAFYAAEDYHQDYYKKNPLRYNYYRSGCRRDQRLQAVWGE